MTEFEWIIVVLVTGMFIVSVTNRINVSEIRDRVDHVVDSCDSIRNTVGRIDHHTDYMWQDITRINGEVVAISTNVEQANHGDVTDSIDVNKVLSGYAMHILKGLSATKKDEQYCCLRCPYTDARDCKSVLDDDIKEFQKVINRVDGG